MRMQGLWDTQNIKFKYITNKWVQLSCEHKVTNGATEVKNIRYTIWDKLFGIPFNEKIMVGSDNFFLMLTRRNDQIILSRVKSAELNNKFKARSTQW